MLGKLVAIASATAVIGSAQAESWNCRNHDFEINCFDGKCVNSEDFTPMDVHVSSREMSVCSYSLCEDGPTTAYLSVGEFRIFASDELFVKTPTNEFYSSAVVTLNTIDGAATIQSVGSVTTPANCTRTDVDPDTTEEPSEPENVVTPE